MALNCTRLKSSLNGKFTFGKKSTSKSIYTIPFPNQYCTVHTANCPIANSTKSTSNSLRKVIDYRSISHLMFLFFFQIHFECYTTVFFFSPFAVNARCSITRYYRSQSQFAHCNQRLHRLLEEKQKPLCR